MWQKLFLQLDCRDIEDSFAFENTSDRALMLNGCVSVQVT